MSPIWQGILDIVFWPAPWWFAAMIKALDPIATANLTIILVMFMWARYRAKDDEESWFALRLIVGSGKVLAVSWAWFLNITIMLWVMNADPLKSNVLWYVRLLWACGAIAGTTDLIAATFSQRFRMKWWIVFSGWWAMILCLTLVLFLAS